MVSVVTKKEPANLGRVLKRSLHSMAPLWTLIILFIFFSLASDTFFRIINFRNILIQVSTMAIMSTGVTFVLLTGEIDLSVADVGGLAGVIAAYATATLALPQSLSIILALVITLLLGYFNGFGTARLGIPSFMITLAMMVIAGGLSLYFTRGRVIFKIPDLLKVLGTGSIGPIPIIVIIAVIVLAVAHFVLQYTRYGRYVYMTGANREAAELSGVNTRAVIASCLAISGFTAGLSGLMNLGRLGSAQPSVPSDMLINAIAAVVLGGTSLAGGEGGIPNTIIGLLILGILRNGLDQVSTDVYLKTFITGIILVVALFLNIVASRLRHTAEDE
ncbi:Ribose transport system permease protein RbsC [Moorella thermoacetica]|nr:ribose transport system permease protein RbsC [Moorella thermoacetica]OIQ55304.1 ribose transport system permease protein RbsC [Moorella thermoacetica]OIQ55551.1 ribose transport system permease protein RbsC [Moorella thermoacetica]QCZ99902.1 Ribose transport system permease protein RbsC [Moorella thermoacetica]TYL07444.1 Ribose import permease protein RbsC [Moorella thermoacetica]